MPKGCLEARELSYQVSGFVDQEPIPQSIVPVGWAEPFIKSGDARRTAAVGCWRWKHGKLGAISTLCKPCNLTMMVPAANRRHPAPQSKTRRHSSLVIQTDGHTQHDHNPGTIEK